MLADVIDKKQIKTDAESLAIWGKDWTNGFAVAPSAIVFPESNQQVVDIVRYAIDAGLQLVPSGGRTGLSGGAVAGQGEVVVSFDRMNQIIDFNAEERLITCQAGVVTQVLQEFAQQQNLFYPVDFASSGSSQIGGNVATNAGGIKVIRYGLTRDWVAGLRAVSGTAALLNCNAGLVKNATGYDLRHLFVGSEGTLGLITEVDIRLTTPPEPQMVMVVGVPRVKDLLNVLNTFSARLVLSAFEFFSDLALDKVQAHRNLAQPLAGREAYYALLEFDQSALDQASAAFEYAMSQGWITDGVISQSEAQAQSLWQLREGISESIASYTPYKNDLSVCVHQVPDFLEDVDKFVSDSYPDFEVCWYGHIGDGNLHLNILRPDNMSVADFMAKGHAMSPKIFALVQARGGSISAEHGVGLLKRDFLDYTRSKEEIELMRGLKQVFDPHQIMNPGKLL
jgi:FAD/FMN-containing dehydrogenase